MHIEKSVLKDMVREIKNGGYPDFRDKNKSLNQDELQELADELKRDYWLSEVGEIQKTIYELNEQMLVDVSKRNRSVRDLSPGEVVYLKNALRGLDDGIEKFGLCSKDDLLIDIENREKEILEKQMREQDGLAKDMIKQHTVTTKTSQINKLKCS